LTLRPERGDVQNCDALVFYLTPSKKRVRRDSQIQSISPVAHKNCAKMNSYHVPSEEQMFSNCCIARKIEKIAAKIVKTNFSPVSWIVPSGTFRSQEDSYFCSTKHKIIRIRKQNARSQALK
jgi:hypothetical protein